MAKDINDPIVKALFQKIIDLDPSIEEEARLLENRTFNKKISINRPDKNSDIRYLKHVICQHLPWTISKDLARFFSTKVHNFDRANRIFKIIERVAHLIISILLSQLYDELARKQTKLNRDEIQALDLYGCFVSGKGLTLGNYTHLIITLKTIFNQRRIKCYVSEINTLLNNDFYKRIEPIRIERNKLSHNIKECSEDIVLDLEEKLVAALYEVTFLVHYTLVSVNEIKVQKGRNEDASFEHKLRFLHPTIREEFIIDKTLHEKYSDNDAVVIVRKNTPLVDSLNLSPFIIDANDEPKTYTNREIVKDVYILSGLRTNNSKNQITGLIYSSTNSSKELSVKGIKNYSNYDLLLSETNKIYKILS